MCIHACACYGRSQPDARQVRRGQAAGEMRDVASETDGVADAGPDEAEPANTSGTQLVRVLTYNILHGGGSRLDAIATVIRDSGADIVGVQEVTDPHALNVLAERLGMHCAFAPSRTNRAVGLLSRWPIGDVDTTGGAHLRKALLGATVAVPGASPLRVYVTHLMAEYFEPLAGEPRRFREAGIVLERMQALREAGVPHLVLGDFNTLAPGERLHASAILRLALQVDAARAAGERMAGLPGVDSVVPRGLRPLRGLLRFVASSEALCRLFDLAVSAYVPRLVIRRMLAAGYVDCYVATHAVRAERGWTCSTRAPAGRIDYVFASPGLARRLRCCEILTDSPGRPIYAASDHCPVLAEFQWS